ncbi:putative ribonuclease H-like domain-containing protein [Tanacetum coccineum]
MMILEVIIAKGEYDMWRLRIEQYFQVQDYALWDVIENGNSFKLVPQTITNADGTSITLIPGLVTTEEKVQNKIDVKARNDIDELDLKCQFALLSIEDKKDLGNQDSKNRNQDSSRRTINVEETSFKAMVAIDGVGFDWSYMADDEVPINIALMAFSDSEVMEPKSRKSVSEDISNEVRESPDAPLVKELVSDDKLEKKIVFPTVAKIESVRSKQQEKPVWKLVKYAEMYRSQSARKLKKLDNQKSNIVNAVRENQVNVVKASVIQKGICPIFQTSRNLMKDMLHLGEEPKEGKLLVKEILKLVQKKVLVQNACNDGTTTFSDAEKGSLMSTNVNTGSLNINTVSPTVTTAPLEATHADSFGDESNYAKKSFSVQDTLGLDLGGFNYMAKRPLMDVEVLHFCIARVKRKFYVVQPLGPRAWYETFYTYLLDNGLQRGQIDKTLFIKRVKSDILLVQVYVDDIIFRSTKKELCTEFKKLMHKKFQMSSIGELTFFLGLQVTQKDDGIFISQDKYVDEILKKFGFSTVKTASTPMETSKPLMKDENSY